MPERKGNARLFLTLMGEMYPHLKSKAQSLKHELEGVLPASLFEEVEEQLENLKKMQEVLHQEIQKSQEEDGDKPSTVVQDDIFNLDISSILTDVKDQE